jgi:hypothetical protein
MQTLATQRIRSSILQPMNRAEDALSNANQPRNHSITTASVLLNVLQVITVKKVMGNV